MRDDVRRILDGELGEDEARAVLAALPEAERREAEAHLRLARAAARLERPAPSEGFHARAMARVRVRPPPRRRLWTWLRSPRVTPLGALGGAIAAGLLAIAAAGLLGRDAPAAPQTVLARLELRAPQARSVAVAGDFNGWRPEATPLRRGEGGLWTVGVPLAPGRRYEYQFVVDGEWVADPAAGARAEDGFGGENAVLEL
jgi:anti-sigma factor RsiW